MRFDALITQERILETLGRFNIDEDQLADWEAELGLDIPKDKFGNKLYSQLHINLFKNVKKHLALGRSLSEIKRMVVLPSQMIPAEEEVRKKNNMAQKVPLTAENLQKAHHPNEMDEQTFLEAYQHTYHVQNASLPQERSILESQSSEIQQEMQTIQNPLVNRLLSEMKSLETKTAQMDQQALYNVVPHEKPSVKSLPVNTRSKRNVKRFASAPVSLSTSALTSQPGQNAALVVLIDKLMQEKDLLQDELVRIERKNTHLFDANNIFQQQIKALGEENEGLLQQLKARENFKLIDDKSKLQKQLIEADQRQVEVDKKLKRMDSEVEYLRNSLANKYQPSNFLGNWLEEASLNEIIFDNFGINIESKRNRMFKITHPPERFYGPTAIIETVYDYKTNTLWKRTETLVLTIANENALEGELVMEYALDGTPVAKAIYKVKCYRNGVKPD